MTPRKTQSRNRSGDNSAVKPDVTTVKFRGATFTFPSSTRDWPIRAMQRFQHRDHADGLELLLGAKQWGRFNEVAPLVSDLWEFLPIFAAAAGFIEQDG